MVTFMGISCQRIDTTYYDDDTVAIVFTLNGACKDGTYGYVRIYDKAKATIVHTPPALPLPVAINFKANYQFIDNAYAPYNYHWDFGDGHTKTTFYDTCSHIYHVSNLYNDYKVTLTVRNLVWEWPNPPTFRLISIAKRITVMASPYAVDTAFVHEDEVKLTWQFYAPGPIDGYRVRKGNTWFEINNPNQKWFVDTGVQPGQWYFYDVFAKVNGQLSPEGPGSHINVQTKWVDGPTNLAVVGQPTPNQVKIQWIDNSQVEAKFWIARATDGVWNEFYNDTFANITNYIDTVSFLHKYAYKVRAVDNAGHYSAWSNVVEFSSGVLAHSNYPRMSAYNNGAKVLRYGITLKNQHFWAGGKC
ncbi:MAG: PKD domain-containing protein [candidate division WOR-3 bacterium]